MEKTIDDCKLIEKKNFKPAVKNGKCGGFTSVKSTGLVLKKCRECKFFDNKQ